MVEPESVVTSASDPPKYAAAPFDDQRGDVILQSSDRVNFQVSKFILSMASSIFSDMFSLPQPSNEDGSPSVVPVVQLSESSTTLDNVLRLLYPINRPRLDQQHISLITDALRAGLKYDIGIVIAAAEEAFKNRVKTNEEEAVAGYAYACNMNREGEARIAATTCLRWPVLYAKIPQLALMSGLDHYNLLDFHRRAGAALADLVQAVEFYANTCPEFIESSQCRGFQFQCSWHAATKSALADALKNGPTDFDKVSAATISKGLEKACPECKDMVFLHWADSRDKIVKSLLSRISEVELSFSWK